MPVVLLRRRVLPEQVAAEEEETKEAAAALPDEATIAKNPTEDEAKTIIKTTRTNITTNTIRVGTTTKAAAKEAAEDVDAAVARYPDSKGLLPGMR